MCLRSDLHNNFFSNVGKVKNDYLPLAGGLLRRLLGLC